MTLARSARDFFPKRKKMAAKWLVATVEAREAPQSSVRGRDRAGRQTRLYVPDENEAGVAGVGCVGCGGVQSVR